MEKSELLKEQIAQNKRLDEIEQHIVDEEPRFEKIESDIEEIKEDITELEEWQIKQDEEIERLKGSLYYVGSVPSFVDESNQDEPTETTITELNAFVTVTEQRPPKNGDMVSSLASGNQYLCKDDPDNPPDGTKWIIWSRTNRIATRTDLGMVKVGDGLKVTADGTISEDLTYRHELLTNASDYTQFMNVRLFDNKDVDMPLYKFYEALNLDAYDIIRPSYPLEFRYNDILNKNVLRLNPSYKYDDLQPSTTPTDKVETFRVYGKKEEDTISRNYDLPIAEVIKLLGGDSGGMFVDSNSNGTYIRWPNGIQICFCSKQIATSFGSSGYAGVDASSGVTFKYPANFSNIPIVIANADFQGSMWASVYSRASDSCILKGYVMGRSGYITTTFNFIAIGRW